MSTNHQSIDIKFRQLRLCIGVFGLLLPLLIVVISQCFGCNHIQNSISHYYYTVAGPVFVGIMFGLGLALVFYPTPKKLADSGTWIPDGWDGKLTTFSGLCAWTVAFSATDSIENEPCALFAFKPDGFRTGLHYVSAAVMLIIFSYMSAFIFTRSGGKPKNAWKTSRNAMFITCGAATLVSVGMIGFFAARKWLAGVPIPSKSTFILEITALVPFGIAWLIKGGLVLTDPGDPSVIRDTVSLIRKRRLAKLSEDWFLPGAASTDDIK